MHVECLVMLEKQLGQVRFYKNRDAAVCMCVCMCVCVFVSTTKTKSLQLGHAVSKFALISSRSLHVTYINVQKS